MPATTASCCCAWRLASTRARRSVSTSAWGSSGFPRSRPTGRTRSAGVMRRSSALNEEKYRRHVLRQPDAVPGEIRHVSLVEHGPGNDPEHYRLLVALPDFDRRLLVS